MKTYKLGVVKSPRAKTRICRSLSAVLAGLVLATSMSYGFLVRANPLETKSESIYARLDTKGNVKLVQVVNTWNAKQGTFQDQGEYTKVEALSDLKPITITGTSVSGEVSKDGAFYYQGTLKKNELPWQIKIEYLLNGTSTDPADLPDKSGALEMRISVAPNVAVKGDYPKGMVLQITATFNGNLTSNLVTPLATQVNQGEKILVNAMVFPGRQGEFKWTADVSNFELEGVTFAAIKMGDQFEMPQDGTWGSELNELSAGVSRLASGMSGIKDGLAKVASGSSELGNAGGALIDGGKELSNNATKLSQGLSALATGLEALTNGAKQLSSEGENVVAGGVAISDGLGKLSQNIPMLKQGTANLSEGLAKLIAGLEPGPTPPPVDPVAALLALKQGMAECQTNLDNITQALTTIDGGLRATVAGLKQAINNLPDTDPTQLEVPDAYTRDVVFANYQIPQADQTNESVIKLADALVAKQNELIAVLRAYKADATTVTTVKSTALALIGNLEELSTNLQSTKNGLTSLNNGFITIKAGVDTLIDQTISALNGQAKLKEALLKLHEGAKALDQGMSSLDTGVTDLTNGSLQFTHGLELYHQGVARLTAGLGETNSGTATLASGLSQYSQGVSTFVAGIGGYVLGVTKLETGLGALDAGALAVKDGLNTLKDKTSNMPEMLEQKFEEELAKWTGSNVKLTSFANPGASVKSIQFLMITDAITVPKPEVIQPERDKTTFLDRLKKLFGLGK